MQTEPAANVIIETAAPARQASEARRIFRVMFSRWIVAVGAFIIIAIILVVIFAPLVAPYNPNKQALEIRLQQPTREHVLGTDELGRDVLSRVIFGTRISLMVGLLVISIASLIGMSLGILAGYFGRWTNNVIMRITDAMMSLPPLVLALAIATAIGGGLKGVILSLGIAMVPGYCRLMCGQVLSIKEDDYITGARSLGARDSRVMLRHILPNAFPPLLVLLTLTIGSAILSEAGLSFLGIGVEPGTATWGSMVSDGYKYLFTNPLLSFAPGIAITLTVLSFNMVGDGLRDALDPRLRGTL
ncbi:MAG: ABC transporter permease [Dehalococcoidales bacterium]|jgi:peptide/nickel transport system permease protein/oligopeptide transport system permease protein